MRVVVPSQATELETEPIANEAALALRVSDAWTAAAPSAGVRSAFSYNLCKRTVDVALAASLLVVLLPLLLAIGLAIRLTSAGPALFRQERYGRRWKKFQVMKFRTMTVAEPTTRASLLTDAGRITRFGHFLRQTGLDEIPQLVNVIRGEMSLIGPRPHPLALDDFYDKVLPGYSRRFEVLPGVSGLAQVRGHRGPINEPSNMEKRLASDIEYVDRRSLWLDLMLIFDSGLILASALLEALSPKIERRVGRR